VHGGANFCAAIGKALKNQEKIARKKAGKTGVPS
jgi:hypothetical protein